MRLIACINTFDSPESLERTLHSVKGIADHLIVVDGPYYGWPRLPGYEKRYNETKELVARAGIPYDYIWTNGLRQKDKRNLYLKNEKLRKGDWLLVLDDDETLDFADGLKEELQETHLQYGTLEIHNSWMGLSYPNNRLIMWQPGLEYSTDHARIDLNGEKLIELAGPPYYPVSCKTSNHPELRTQRRQHERSLWRMMRFLFCDREWRDGFFETGPSGTPDYFDKGSVKRVLGQARSKILRGSNEFDGAFMEWLSWISQGCQREMNVTAYQRGALMAVLYSCGVIPNPYSSENEKE